MNDQSPRTKILQILPLFFACCLIATIFWSQRRQSARRAEIQARMDRLQEQIKSLQEQTKSVHEQIKTAETLKRSAYPASATPAATSGTAPEKPAVTAP